MNNDQFDLLLTADECKTILFRYFGDDNYKLINYKLRPFSDNFEGFLGEHLLLDIEAQRNDEQFYLNFFTKCKPSNDFMDDFCRQMNAFGNEICFYEKIMPKVKQTYPEFDETIIPKYYYSNNDLIVLENCTKVNFQVADTEDILPIDHIFLILKAFAKLHAASIICEERIVKELGTPYRFTDDYEKYLKETFFIKDEQFTGYIWHRVGLRTNLEIIDRMDHDLENRDEFKRRLADLAEQCCDIAKPSTIFRNVICHADLWRNNVMFRYENNKPVCCKFLDFQLMKYYPPAYDLLKFYHQVTSSKTRQHHYDEFNTFYYKHLCHELKLAGLNANDVLPYDEFCASLKYMLGYVKIEASYYYHFQRVGFDFIKELAATPEKFKESMFKTRTFMLNKKYSKGTYFQRWMDEILLEIYDILFNDNFSREDCRTVLANKLTTTDYELIRYNVQTLNEQNGFLGCHKKIESLVKVNDKQMTVKFFAKFLPQTKFNNYAISSGAFDNEVFIYDCVFKTMKKLHINIDDCVPKCFFTRRNDVLVFEDIQEQGYRPINKHKALNYDQVCVILSALAKLHAASFILEEKLTETNRKPFRIVDEYASNLKEVTYVDEETHVGKAAIESVIKGYYTHIDLFPDSNSKVSDAELKRKATIIYNKLMYIYTAPSKQYRNVICHGDLWSSNVLLKNDENGRPVAAKIVDFQCVKKCPPGQDVVAFIYLTTSRKFRSNFFNDILKYYYDELKRNIESYNYNIDHIITYREFLDSCEYYKVFAISQAISHFHFIMTPVDAMIQLFKDDRLCHKTLSIDRSEFIIKMCNEYPQYKSILHESLKDFRVMCENTKIE